MKIKCILMMFLVGINIYMVPFASASSLEGYCSFEGMIDRAEITLEEEFAMFLEPAWTPNFHAVVMAIFILTSTPPEDLNNQKCPVYKYAREFLDCYNKNKEKITKDKLYLTKLLDAIQERTNEPIVSNSWWQIF